MILKRFFAISTILFLSFPILGIAKSDSTNTKLNSLLEDYYDEIDDADGINDAYSALKFGQTYTLTSPPSLKEYVINNVTAEDILDQGETRCADNDTAADIKKFTQVLGAEFDVKKYKAAKEKACKVIQVAAELKYRYDNYQDLKTNGYNLVNVERSQRLKFKTRKRHVAGRIVLNYKPDLMDTKDNGFSAEDRFEYNSYIKWSSDSWAELNIAKRIKESQGTSDDMRCMTVIPDWGQLCTNIVSIDAGSLVMQTWVRVRRYSRTKTVDLGTVTIPAPFGFLDEIAQMKEKSQKKLKDKATKKVAGILNIDSKTMKELNKAVKNS